MLKFDRAKNIVLLILCLLFTPSLGFANNYDSIEYNLSPDIKNSVLSVEMTLKGEFAKQLRIDLPNKWASADYAKQITNIKILSHDSFKIIKKPGKHQMVVTLPDFTNQIKISYDIHQKSDDPSCVHEAIIRDDLIHSPGYGLFATPDIESNKIINVTINWLNIASNWKIMSSYGTNKMISRKITMPELLHAIYVAGKVRIYQIGDKSSPVFLSLYGKFDIKDQKIVSDLKGVIANQRLFFNDYDFPYYAISLIEGDEPESMGGTMLSNSFTAFLPKGISRTDYYILFAHEHLHNWIGGKIRNNVNEELNYWWTEGFTDYYSRIIALRSNSITREEFTKEVNQFLRQYYLSPVINEPNSRIKKDFWNNYDVEKLPYYRGFVCAIYLNNLIQKDDLTHSLDNIMHDLFKEARAQTFSIELFKNLAKKYIASGVDTDITNFIDQGKTIPLENINLPILKTLMGRYYLGFDRESVLRERIIKHIDKKSNAYKAGLRNGQKILGYDVPGGQDPNQIITIHTSKGIFKFRPEHYDKTACYQIQETLSTAEKQQINKFFGVK
jgi:predicted metalloprotease with PDZ domain